MKPQPTFDTMYAIRPIMFDPWSRRRSRSKRQVAPSLFSGLLDSE